MKHCDHTAARYRWLLIAQHIVIWFLLASNITTWVLFAAAVNSFSVPYSSGFDSPIVTTIAPMEGSKQ
ncbi:hypothetical protein [Canibacter oris]|uniref:Uncharacterized protein n=1 Tax=Canibacter oris TaxID=1365628 RepID=A0A840DRD3_9MICO|nr:hypothetical protein [Canibacter oris]MBB4072069.1 hypothetical protein [Canibacter oris]